MFAGNEVASLATWATGIVTFLLFLYVVGTWNYDAFRKRKMRYLPANVPFAGNIGPLFTGAIRYPTMILQFYNRTKGWPYVGLFEFTTPFIMLRDPELIKDILVKHFDNFNTHRALGFRDLDPMVVGTIFCMGGDEWKKMKYCMTPVFTTSKIKTQFSLLQECSQFTACYLEKQLRQYEASNPGDVLEVDFKDIYKRFAINVTASIACGANINSHEDPDSEFVKNSCKFIDMGTDTSVLTVAGYMLCRELMHILRIPIVDHKAHRFLQQVVVNSITQREKQNEVRPDVIQLLLALKKQNSSMSDEDLSAIASTFFIAGDTATMALFFMSYLLALHPEVQTRLQNELDTIVPEGDPTKITYEDIRMMTYMEMVLSEALRMYPTLMTVDRMCMSTCSIPVSPKEPPLTIKAGEAVMVPIYALHHDPEYFPEPFKFDPERFNEENIKNIKPYTYMPFGFGPRKCIGQRFGQVQIKLLLATLLTKFTFRITDSSPVPLINKKRNFLWVPEKGCILGITLRGK